MARSSYTLLHIPIEMCKYFRIRKFDSALNSLLSKWDTVDKILAYGNHYCYKNIICISKVALFYGSALQMSEN